MSDNANSSTGTPGLEELLAAIEGLPAGSAVIFDFDGTLAYTEDIHWRVFHDELANMFGIDYPFLAHRQMTGKSYTELWRSLGELYGFDGTTGEVIAKKEEMLHIDTGDKLEEIGRGHYSYVPAVLAAARASKAKVLCVSSNTLSSLTTSLARWGMLFEFSGVYSAETLKEDKASVIAGIAAAFPGRVVVLDDSRRIAKRMVSIPNVVMVGAGHPQAYEPLEESGCCDILLDLRGESPDPDTVE